MNPSPPRVRVPGLVNALELWHTKGAVGQPSSSKEERVQERAWRRLLKSGPTSVDRHVENIHFVEKPVSVIQFPMPFRQIGFFYNAAPSQLSELSKSGEGKFGVS